MVLQGRFRRHALLAAAGVVLLTAALTLRVGGDRGAAALSDLAAVVAAGIATRACWRASRRAVDERAAWLGLSIAGGLWCLGEILWSWFEVVRDEEVPFPSVADAFYLAAVPVAAIALVHFARGARAGHRVRMVLDGALVGGAVLFVSWALVLGDALKGDGSGVATHIVSVAYPVTDFALVTLALLALLWGHRRGPLVLLAGGLALMGFTDSAFTYLTADGSYSSSSWITSGWVGAYLLLALGADVQGEPVAASVTDQGIESVQAVLLPYVPVAGAFSIGVARALGGGDIGPMLASLAIVLALVTFARQAVTLLENRRLARHLQVLVDKLNAHKAELAELAMHDPLTGLPNRRSFSERLLAELTPELPRPAILYIDLDGFKGVNDRMGHAVGDDVLVLAARRLVASLPAETPVARLGGDEFVALIPDGQRQGARIARSVVDGFTLPFRVDGRRISISASVGLALAPTSGDTEEALRRADAAMYAAKRSGKARAVAYPDDRVTAADFPGEDLPLAEVGALD